MYTLDTNLIIYFLKEDPKAVEFMRESIFQGSRFFISSITETELFSYPEMTKEEFIKIDDILKTLSIISLDSQIARIAAFFKRKYNIPLADAVIAATGYLTNSVVVTRNIKDFQKIQEITIKPI